MKHDYQPEIAEVVAIKSESIDTRLLRLRFIDKKKQRDFEFLPGQFMEIGLSGWGECPISICSSPFTASGYFELAIRDVGQLTHRLNQLKPGDRVEVRGPYGNGFNVDDFKDKPLLLIAGGCGFAPLRGLILDYMEGRLENTVLQVFYGCRNQDTLLFKDSYDAWRRRAEVEVVLEKPEKGWSGAKGLVTDLFKTSPVTKNTVAILVGPPKMYRFVIDELKKKKVSEENIYLSLERRMSCGLGVCQHCAIGPYYVCKDGPVFRWTDIKDIPEII